MPYFFIQEKSSIINQSGKDALDLLQRLTTNDISELSIQNPIRTLLTNNKGRIIDSILLFMDADRDLNLLCDSGDTSMVIKEIDRFTIIEESNLYDNSDQFARITAFGDVEDLFFKEPFNINTDSKNEIFFEGFKIILLEDRTKKAPWYELIVKKENLQQITNILVSLNCTQANEMDLNSYCIYNLIPSYNREYGIHTNPIESGLVDLISFEKGCYVGQEVIARIHNYNKVKRAVVLLKLDKPVSIGDKLTIGSSIIGEITSFGGDHNLIALGLVKIKYSSEGTTYSINEGEAKIMRSSK
tara:strand:- start:363 stop:1262 length:900 start_codon:yes stop_codon:yes gene_type:complete